MQPLVLHAINSLDVSGGAEQQLVENLRHFDHRRFRHTLVSLFSTAALSRLREIGDLDHHAVHGPGGPSSLRPGTLLGFARLVRRLRPDLIHATLHEAGLVARLVGPPYRVPVVESLVNISHERIRVLDSPAVRPWKLRAHALVDRITAPRVTRFHAISEVVAASWSRVVGIDPADIEIIPRGVNVERLDGLAARGPGREELHRALDLPRGARLVLAVGRQEPQKGHRYLLEALPGILEAAPSTVLLLAGREGSLTPLLRSLVRQAGLAPHVRLLGRRDDVPALMRASDVFVFPSLFEGFGVALLEALASGMAVVTVDRAPMSELVEPDRTGLLVPPADVGALREGITRLLRDRDLAARLGAAARHQVCERYSSGRAAARLEELYAAVLRGPGSGDPPRPGGSEADPAGGSAGKEGMDRARPADGFHGWSA